MNNLLISYSDTTIWYILFLMSFIGGVIASVSPCSLAMLPLIIGYVGGFSKETTFRTFIQLLSFIFGTAIIFTIIGIICAVTGNVFASVFGGYFKVLIASLLLVIGLKLLDILDFDTPMIIKSIPVNSSSSLFVYPVFLGIVFALAGTPCSTPVLAGIMAFAALGKSLPMAVIMLFLFALGQGLILILAGLFTSCLKNMHSLAKYTNILIKISGILLVVVALFLYWLVFTPLL